MTQASKEIAKLLAYSSNLYLDDDEERRVRNEIRRDLDFNQTMLALEKAGVLGHLFTRANPKNRRELVQVLGGKLPNPAVDKLIRPHLWRWITQFGVPPVFPLAGTWVDLYEVSRDLQTNIKRLGLVMKAAPFNLAPYTGLIGKKKNMPFSGSGATGVNPTTQSVGAIDSIRLALDRPSTVARYSNPIPGDLGVYLTGLTAKQRRDQARLLMGLPISTVVPQSYIGWIPSREQVTRAAAKVHNLQPELVAAFLLAEQRDQSQYEDAKDFDAATSAFSANTSIGLGQIVVSTARRSDLFADLLSASRRKGLSHDTTAHLLASDEFNIFGAARYLRAVADEGAKHSAATLPNTHSAFPGISFADYARNSSHWPEANIKALGSEYTSRAWDDRLSPGWGRFVLEAYQDIVAAGIF